MAITPCASSPSITASVKTSTKAQTSDLQHQSVTAEWTTRRPYAPSTAEGARVLGSKLGD